MGHKYVKEEDTFSTSANGTVPKPTATDVSNNKFLRADGTWQSGAGGSTVSADQVVSSGTEIGGVTIDGTRTAFYAPLRVYSATEHVVGTWIDGKPVYERVFALSSRKILPTQTWTSLSDVSIANIKGIIDAVAYDVSAASNTKTTAVNIYMTDCSDTSYLRVWNTRNADVGITHIKLQYIKVTD